VSRTWSGTLTAARAGWPGKIEYGLACVNPGLNCFSMPGPAAVTRAPRPIAVTPIIAALRHMETMLT